MGRVFVAGSVNTRAQIHALAMQGRERAGRFGRRRWDEPIRIAEARQATGVS